MTSGRAPRGAAEHRPSPAYIGTLGGLGVTESPPKRVQLGDAYVRTVVMGERGSGGPFNVDALHDFDNSESNISAQCSLRVDQADQLERVRSADGSKH
jgi:hypothetical protein